MASGRSSSSPHSMGSASTPQRVRPIKHSLQSTVNGIRESYEDRNNDYLCPICFELIEEAHITRCGHTYCFACISRAIKENGRCPRCGQNIKTDQVFPNFLLNEVITKYKTKLVAREFREALGSGDSLHSNGLRDFVASGSQNLSLPDVNVMLEVLTQRKYVLEAETCTAQNELLYEFLKHLRQQREEKLNQYFKECGNIKMSDEFFGNGG